MKKRMLALTLLSLLLATAARSQQTMLVNWQARMTDSLTIGLRMTYDARLKAGERARLADATVAKRGQVRRDRVTLRNVDCHEERGAVLGLSFSCDFEYRGVRYRLRGRYTDDPENTGSGHQSIQCIPLTLGRDIIEQGGYQPARH